MGRRLLTLLAVVSIALVAGCGDDDSAESPAATLGTTSTTLSVEDEVEAAYLRSWDVLAAAALELDPSQLDELYHGRALELVREDIRKLEERGARGRFVVEHDFVVAVESDGESAEVTDSYINHSVLLDLETREPIEPDPNTPITETYRLERIDGAWKVIEILR